MQTSGNTVEEFNDQFGHVVAWCSLFNRKLKLCYVKVMKCIDG